MNITTEKRICKSLKKITNLNIVKEVLYSDDNMGAIETSLSKTNCTHKSSVVLMWGPRKTKTVVFLFSLLKLKCRTLICAPTNHAIRQVATCVERLGIRGDVEEIFLENKVKALKKLQPFDFQEENTITKICLERASLVMCTASHSYNLHNLQNEPFQFLVIDKAAQLKEAESTIPLQLPVCCSCW
ncbi:putative P-loop containing nucleoside triphosphate hydrolase, DNA2/NAM7 helicase, helicase [Helianthus anomalus]